MSDNERAEDDLEQIPTGIPPERVQAAKEALGLPGDETLITLDMSRAAMVVAVTPGPDGTGTIQYLCHMDKRLAVAALRALADRWDLEAMGVSGD